ncbi:MAG: LptA/OstA family protein [Opitutales bacterium]|nr:LptA/OstA family protein [Opitutales bacterium]
MKKFFGVIIYLFIGIIDNFADDIHTMVTSEHVEIIDCNEETSFIFSDKVHVSSEDFDLTSDRLEVLLKKVKDDHVQVRPKIEKLHAIGNVCFSQHNRSGHANEAIVLPKDEVMCLLGEAEITDEDGTAKGDKLYLDKNTRSIKAESRGRSVVLIPQGEKSTDSLFKSKNKVKDRLEGPEDEE